VTKYLVGAEGVAKPVKIFVSSSLIYHTKFGCCVSYRVGSWRRSPKIRGCWSHIPLG